MSGQRNLARASVQDIDDQIALLVSKRDLMLRRQREALGRLCERAGLLNADIANAELEAALREIAERFQKQALTVDDDFRPAGAPATGAAAHGDRSSKS
jgi:TraC-like protein